MAAVKRPRKHLFALNPEVRHGQPSTTLRPPAEKSKWSAEIELGGTLASAIVGIWLGRHLPHALPLKLAFLGLLASLGFAAIVRARKDTVRRWTFLCGTWCCSIALFAFVTWQLRFVDAMVYDLVRWLWHLTVKPGTAPIHP